MKTAAPLLTEPALEEKVILQEKALEEKSAFSVFSELVLVLRSDDQISNW